MILQVFPNLNNAMILYKERLFHLSHQVVYVTQVYGGEKFNTVKTSLHD